MRLCLVGRGIAASPSPAMQEAALRASGIDGTYELRDTTEDELPGFVESLRSDFRGCNVTIPYKRTLAARCDRLEGDALVLGAVNTISVDDGELAGDNTDARGFELALEAEELTPAAGFEAVVLGAGGAAAAVLLAASRLGASRLTLAARRPDATTALARRLRLTVVVDVVGWSAAALRGPLERAQLVVNATPAGLADLPFHPRSLPASCTVADVRYRPAPVDLVAAARASGHPACDGGEMLLQQGMLSFTRWTGRVPPMPAARRALLAELG